jgi:hypothetical protein
LKGHNLAQTSTLSLLSTVPPATTSNTAAAAAANAMLSLFAVHINIDHNNSRWPLVPLAQELI